MSDQRDSGAIANTRQAALGSHQASHAVIRSPNGPAGAPPSVSAPAIVFEHVTKWYGPVIGVNQVTLELRPGITGLVGANGAGKSTLMRLITGHLRPDLGTAEVLGHSSWTAAAKQHVGYCPDVDVFYEEMSGRQFVET